VGKYNKQIITDSYLEKEKKGKKVTLISGNEITKIKFNKTHFARN